MEHAYANNDCIFSKMARRLLIFLQCDKTCCRQSHVVLFALLCLAARLFSSFLFSHISRSAHGRLRARSLCHCFGRSLIDGVWTASSVLLLSRMPANISSLLSLSFFVLVSVCVRVGVRHGWIGPALSEPPERCPLAANIVLKRLLRPIRGRHCCPCWLGPSSCKG